MKNHRLLIIFLTIFIDLLGFGLVIPILAIYATKIGAPEWMVGFIIAAYPLVNFFCVPFLGSLSDRVGRRPIILGAILINLIANLVFAYAFTIPMLILARLLAGLGSSNIAAAQAYIADITPPENRAKSLGMIGAAFGLGFVLGPAIATPIAQHFPNNYVTVLGFLSAGLCFLNLISAYFLLPESLEKLDTRAKMNVVSITDFRDALSRPVIKELFSFSFVYIVAFMFLQVTLSLLWKNHYSLNEAQVAKGFMAVGLITAVFQVGLVGRLVKRFGERNLLYWGTFIMAAGMMMPPFGATSLAGSTDMSSIFIAYNLVSITFICMGSAMMTPTYNSLIMQHTPAHEQGKMQGLVQSFGSLARVVGSALGSVLFWLGHAIPYISATLLLLLCSWLVILAIRQMQTRPV